MDALTLIVCLIAVFAMDSIGFKYKSLTIFLVAGILAIFALANLAADNSVEISHAYSGGFQTLSLTAAANTHDFLTWLAVFAVTATVNFLMVLERQMQSGED